MILRIKRALPALARLLVFAALAGWLLRLMPPHRPIEYMIIGTAATAGALGTVFARLVIRPYAAPIARGREQALYRMRRTSGS